MTDGRTEVVSVYFDPETLAKAKSQVNHWDDQKADSLSSWVYEACRTRLEAQEACLRSALFYRAHPQALCAERAGEVSASACD